MISRLIILTLVFPFFLQAQSYYPSKATIEHEDAQRPSLVATFEAEPKAVKEAWTDYLKSEYDLKLKGFGFLSNKDLLSAEKVTVSKISSNQMDFYTHFEEVDDKTKMNVFASMGYDIYVNPEEYPRAYRNLRSMMNGFVRGYVPGYYEDRIEETADNVEDLEDDIADLESDISKNKERIEENQQEIKDMEKDNEELQQSLKDKEAKLQEKKKLLEQRRSKLQEINSELKE